MTGAIVLNKSYHLILLPREIIVVVVWDCFLLLEQIKVMWIIITLLNKNHIKDKNKNNYLNNNKDKDKRIIIILISTKTNHSAV